MIKTGTGVYAFFGLGWMLAGLGHFGGAAMGVAVPLGLVVAGGMVAVARRLPDPGAAGEAPAGAAMDAAAGRRRFGQVNAVQWLLIAAIAAGCGAGGVPGLIMPLVAVVVGLHFFPLVRVFGDRRLAVPGAALTALGVAGVVAHAADASPGAVITLVGVGSAAVLWSLAVWSIVGVSRAVRETPRQAAAALPEV